MRKLDVFNSTAFSLLAIGMVGCEESSVATKKAAKERAEKTSEEKLSEAYDWIAANEAAMLNSMAVRYYTQGNYAKAEPLFKRSLAIKEKAFDPDHTDVATTFANLADLYRATKRFEEAEKLQRRVAQIRAMKR